MRDLKQATAANVMVFMTDSADHVTGKAGLTLTVTASKDGGAFAGIAPTVTERGSGWYALALTAAMTDTLGDLALHITSAGSDPTDVLCRVVAGSLDADVSSRMATFTYTAPDNATISSISGTIGVAGAGLTALGDARLANLDAAITSRMATFVYTAPDNAGIAELGLSVADLPADIGARVIEGALTQDEITRIILAFAAANGLDLEGAHPRFRDMADSKDRIVATYVAGTRTITSVDGS